MSEHQAPVNMDSISNTTSPPIWVPTATFLDLPVEMRTLIYTYVLADPKAKDSTHITLVRHKKRRSELYQHKPSVNRSVKDEGEYDRESKTYKPYIGRTAILQTNKQIHKEGLEVLYDRRLVFRSFRELRDILPLIGDGVKHLRDVEIETDGYNPTLAKSVLASLSASGGLRKVRLSHIDICSIRGWKAVTVEQVARDTKVLLESLQRAYESANRSWNVLDVMELFLEPCRTCRLQPAGTPVWSMSGVQTVATRAHIYTAENRRWCHCQCSEAEVRNAALQARLRAAVAKALGIVEEGREGAEGKGGLSQA